MADQFKEITRLMYIIMIPTFVLAFILLISALLRLSKDKVIGDQEKGDRKGVCAEVCAPTTSEVIFKGGFFYPFLVIIIGFAIFAGIVYKKHSWAHVEAAAAHGVGQAMYGLSQYKIIRLVAMVILVVFGIWCAVVLVLLVMGSDIPFLSVKKYDYSSKTTCNQNGKKWCKKAGSKADFIVMGTGVIVAFLVLFTFIYAANKRFSKAGRFAASKQAGIDLGCNERMHKGMQAMRERDNNTLQQIKSELEEQGCAAQYENLSNYARTHYLKKLAKSPHNYYPSGSFSKPSSSGGSGFITELSRFRSKPASEVGGGSATPTSFSSSAYVAPGAVGQAGPI